MVGCHPYLLQSPRAPSRQPRVASMRLWRWSSGQPAQAGVVEEAEVAPQGEVVAVAPAAADHRPGRPPPPLAPPASLGQPHRARARPESGRPSTRGSARR